MRAHIHKVRNAPQMALSGPQRDFILPRVRDAAPGATTAWGNAADFILALPVFLLVLPRFALAIGCARVGCTTRPSNPALDKAPMWDVGWSC